MPRMMQSTCSGNLGRGLSDFRLPAHHGFEDSTPFALTCRPKRAPSLAICLTEYYGVRRVI